MIWKQTYGDRSRRYSRAPSLRSLVFGYECGRVFPAGVGPESPSRDATKRLSSRFSRSVETRRRYGWLKMVLTRGASSDLQCVPFGGWCHDRQRARGVLNLCEFVPNDIVLTPISFRNSRVAVQEHIAYTEPGENHNL